MGIQPNAKTMTAMLLFVSNTVFLVVWLSCRNPWRGLVESRRVQINLIIYVQLVVESEQRSLQRDTKIDEEARDYPGLRFLWLLCW